MVKLNKISEEGFRKCKELSSAKCEWASWPSWITGGPQTTCTEQLSLIVQNKGAVAEEIRLGAIFLQFLNCEHLN